MRFAPFSLLGMLAMPFLLATTIRQAPPREDTQPGLANRAPFINIKAAPYNAVGDGTTDDTSAIQAALNTGKDVYCPTATYKITNSLYMNTTGQILSGSCTITMDAGLALPMLWLGASDATGTDPGAGNGPLNMKVNGLRFSCTGSKTIGSSGIAFKRATTSILDGVLAWNCYAGIDVRGYSIANTLIGPELQFNTIGLYDRADTGATCPSTCSTFEGSRIIGGRIEQNDNEGALLGSKGLGFTGTTIEGNSFTGALSQVRITQGFNQGLISFVNVYFEEEGTNTATNIIKVDDAACVAVELVDTQVNGLLANAANLYIIETASTCTVQGYSILGGRYQNFKNYIGGSIVNNSVATIMPSWADGSHDASTNLSATAGAIIWQLDRLFGFKTASPIVGGAMTGTSFTATAAAAATGVTLNANALMTMGTATLKGDASAQLITGGVLFLSPSGNSTLHAGAVQRDDTANSLVLKGNLPDSASNIGVKIGNVTTFTNAGTLIACLYSDNVTTKAACFDLKGGFVPVGVTFANIATGSTANGTIQYCTDCVTAPTCAGSGSGAIAQRINGAWNCNGGGPSNKGTITLSTGSGTATVLSGANCICTDTTANASVKCAVATTTLTATGTGSDVIAYQCF